jgi:uncharacterized protein YndB with AHSA1/START domain
MLQPNGCKRMMRDVKRHLVLHAPVALVWEALTDSTLLSEWFGADIRLVPRVGERASFRRPDGSIRYAIVEHIVTERVLVLRWMPFETAEDGTLRQRPPSTVRFVLSPREGDTVLDVTESWTERPEEEVDRLSPRATLARPPWGGPSREPQARAAL